MTQNVITLRVAGMKCDGCVARAREAVATVSGVVESDFDLAAGTAAVTGNAEPEELARALTAAGYPATLSKEKG